MSSYRSILLRRKRLEYRKQNKANKFWSYLVITGLCAILISKVLIGV